MKPGSHYRQMFRLFAILALIVAAEPATFAQPGEGQQNKVFIVIKPVEKGDEARVSKLKPMSKAQLQQLVNRPGSRVMTPSSLAASKKNLEAAIQRAEAQVRQAYARNPEVLQLLPKDLEGTTLSYRNKRGQTEKRELLGRVPMLFKLQEDAAKFNDKAVQMAAYTSLYNGALKRATAIKHQKVLDTLKAQFAPAKVQSQTVTKIRGDIINLAELIGGLFGPDQPPSNPGNPHSCDQEIGRGYGGDMDGCSSPGSGYNPNGLYQRCSWPLKFYNTCVRNQAARGTCPSFSIIGAVESRIAVQFNRWVNLSEQDLYKQQRLSWVMGIASDYGDGYIPTLSFAQQLVNGYVFPYERDWDYNPSCSRVDDDVNKVYTNSCVNYNGGDCSDTTHQARLVDCYSVQETIIEEVITTEWVWSFANFLWSLVPQPVANLVETIVQYEVCVYDTQIPGTSGYRVALIGGFVHVYDPAWSFFNPNWMNNAKAHLDLQHPIVFCFNVPDSFRNATQNGGFVQYSSNESASGGHCVLMTGYVNNGELPSGIAPGAGGGYFIIKNSWGTGWGDMGYCYVPFDWVDRFATGMDAVTSISQ